MDAGMPEQIEPTIKSNDNGRFCNETKPFYGENDETSDCDDALLEATMDNDSDRDPSFKSGSEHAESSEYSFSHTWAFNHFEIYFHLGENEEDDDDDDDADIGNDDDDSDEFTPAKHYKKKPKLEPGQPKRGRGRPRKIRDPAEELEKGNWRNRKIHKCSHCPKKFTRRSHVTVHIRKRHGFECSICNTRCVGKPKFAHFRSFIHSAS